MQCPPMTFTLSPIHSLSLSFSLSLSPSLSKLKVRYDKRVGAGCQDLAWGETPAPLLHRLETLLLKSKYLSFVFFFSHQLHHLPTQKSGKLLRCAKRE